ncbi:GNAT superfamily N-acetyltransferase [Bradyrhizobium elkanii]|uniref:GNAT family N-acetyltransferase n=1 Tax=Bradyrhizobium elkanii TaxID=29448 RepID=UPI003518287F
MTSSGLSIRRLTPADTDAAAGVYRAAFDETLPWLAGPRTPDEDRWFYRERMFATCTLWGAFDGAAMSGVIAFRDGWIGQLYVLPGAQGRGIGGALLEIARPGPAAALDVSMQRPRAASTRRAVLSRMRRPTSAATRRGSPACAIAGRAGRRVSDIDRNS